ncbi:TRAP transporter small permease [Roseovarius sp. MMSF_3281]|uniref:TRAP transporter small permease n=1 Tax=Roseovarius sp. MMSF_3281 TaxID=3046694 RepID=UPI00273EAA57|nr:TRAP transporter small permease [Roseovarius sp. MMSF_3281]
MQKLANSLSKIANILAILALVWMFGHIIFEMVLRNVFDRSTFVLDEFVGYAVSALTFLALGEAFRRGELIQVRLFQDHLGAAAQWALQFFGHLAAFCVGTLILWYVGKSVVRNFERGTTSASIAEVPQWIPEGFVLLGIAVFIVQVFVALCHVATGRNSMVEGE